MFFSNPPPITSMLYPCVVCKQLPTTAFAKDSHYIQLQDAQTSKVIRFPLCHYCNAQWQPLKAARASAFTWLKSQCQVLNITSLAYLGIPVVECQSMRHARRFYPVEMVAQGCPYCAMLPPPPSMCLLNPCHGYMNFYIGGELFCRICYWES